MRVFSLIIVWFALSNLMTVPIKNKNLVLDSGSFKVKGRTSIGKFDCDYKFEIKDTLLLHEEIGLHYEIPVKDFGCGNFLLNKDFRKTLKHKEFPIVYFKLMNVKKDHHLKYQFDLYLKIAGTEKILKNLNLKQHKHELRGEVQLMFSDFNLKPPQKLGGAIKVEEDIHISIVLNLEK